MARRANRDVKALPPLSPLSPFPPLFLRFLDLPRKDGWGQEQVRTGRSLHPLHLRALHPNPDSIDV